MRRACSSRISAQRRFILLAPDGTAPEYFPRVTIDAARSEELLAEMQCLRGEIYIEDGAITASQLSTAGRHELPEDRQSWHLLVIDQKGRVRGCMRYLPHRNTISMAELGISSSALAQGDRWGAHLRKAVEADLDAARDQAIGVGEAGGWALAEELRCSTEALRMVLATYSLAQILGDAIVFSTATMRNGSATILRRIGGTSLIADGIELPSYYDPHYRCDMQLLRFDSRLPNAKYNDWVNQLRSDLCASPVFATHGPSTKQPTLVGRSGRNHWVESIR
jgi:hypothetical protein